ncbi:hypothetical protein GCM10009530_51970 [Microbispora corallina]
MCVLFDADQPSPGPGACGEPRQADPAPGAGLPDHFGSGRQRVQQSPLLRPAGKGKARLPGCLDRTPDHWR